MMYVRRRMLTLAGLNAGELLHFAGAGNRHLVRERVVLRVRVRELPGHVVHRPEREHVRRRQHHLWADGS